MKFLVVTPESVETIEASDPFEHLKGDKLIGSIQYEHYPSHYKLNPNLRCLVEEDGIYKRTAYNRWGIVGNFAVIKVLEDGKFVGLTKDEIKAIEANLQDRSGGYLDPRCFQESPFREPFQRHGEPPAGAIPNKGRWFDR